jgi:hypothetical protein
LNCEQLKERMMIRKFFAVAIVAFLAFTASLSLSAPAHAVGLNYIIDIDDAQSSYTVPTGATVWTVRHTPQDPAMGRLRISERPKGAVSAGIIADSLPPQLMAQLKSQMRPNQHLMAYTFETSSPTMVDIVVEYGSYQPVVGFAANQTKIIHVTVQ